MSELTRSFYQSSDPAVFKVEFGDKVGSDEHTAWVDIARGTARELGIYEKMEIRASRIGEVDLAFIDGRDYGRLMMAMEPKVQEMVWAREARQAAYVQSYCDRHGLERPVSTSDRSEMKYSPASPRAKPKSYWEELLERYAHLKPGPPDEPA